ncbi:NADPH-dependent FMN reductase [Acidobacteria bacterium Mor1]|nr:NADPH-dependent FMN reductase [Acidobacteria bacterium Mor1]
MAKILAFAGSARAHSVNKKLVHAVAGLVRDAGGEVTEIDLRDFPMPLYDGDLEEAEGAPESADRLYAIMKAHDGFLIACPEYNSSITPLLKNTIDWLSRPREGEPRLGAFAGKTAALMAASPGGLGGLRGLVHVRAILGNIGVHVIPEQLALGTAHKAFAEDGTLSDNSGAQRAADLASCLVRTAGKLGE